jgi:hypothetical protein
MAADHAADPLARLAAELERLAEAQLALGAAAASLIPEAPVEARRGLGDAAAAARGAARAASEASARAAQAAATRGSG